MPQQTVTVDPSQVQTVTVDPSEVQSVGEGPSYVNPEGLPVYQTTSYLNPQGVPIPANAPSIPMYNYPPGSTQLQQIKPGPMKDLAGWEKGILSPLEYEKSGAQQLGQGLIGLRHPESGEQMAGAASDVFRGGVQTMTPFFAPQMIANPWASLTGLITFGAAQQGIEKGAEALGIPKGYARLFGDIGGMYGGHRAYQWLADMAKIPDTKVADAIYEKINLYMDSMKDPTLTPDQRNASKAAIDALLHSLRAEEGWRLPALFPNPNQAEREAYSYMRGNVGVSPDVGAASGSPFVRGGKWLTGMTPAGAVMDVRAKRQTTEALRGQAAQFVSEAAPKEGPSKPFYSEAYDAVNQSEPVNVRLGIDKDGSVIEGNLKAPVDLRELKYDLQPLFDRMQLLPMKDQSTSHAYNALKVLLSGPDHVPVPTAEFALSQFKKAGLLEEGGIAEGLTKRVIPQLQQSIDRSMQQYVGKDALDASRNGRNAARQEFGAEWLDDQFKTAQQEGGFGHERALWNNWTRLSETAKRTMFSPKQVADLNKFFLGIRMLAENPNPPGTALVGAILGQADWAMRGGVVSPLFYFAQVGAAGMSKLLRSDLGVKLLTEGMSIPRTTERGRYVERQLKNLIKDQGLGTPPEGGGGSPLSPGATPGG